MSKLVVRDSGGSVEVTPESAGWSHVGFEVRRLAPGESVERPTGVREVCVVMLGGRADIACGGQRWKDVGSRDSVFAGTPDAVYLPPGEPVTVTATGRCEVALCWAPASRGAEPALIKASDIPPSTRGTRRSRSATATWSSCRGAITRSPRVPGTTSTT